MAVQNSLQQLCKIGAPEPSAMLPPYLEQFFSKRGINWRELSQKHIADPTTLETYRLRRKDAFLRQIPRNVKRIYLDTNFWINLRDVQLGRQKDATWVELLSRIETITKDRVASAVVNAAQYFELLKQSDRTTRSTMAAMMDRFSHGVALQDSMVLPRTQTFAFLAQESTKPIPNFWTEPWEPIGAVIGISTARNELIPDQMLNGFNKMVIDMYYLLTMEEHCALDIDRPTVDYGKSMSAQLNQDLTDIPEGRTTFKEALLAEIGGQIDACFPYIWNAYEIVALFEGSGKDLSEEAKLALFERILDLFRQDKAGGHFAEIRIQAGVYASVRGHRDRKFRPNDLFDFRHASALPYCDFFFAERSLVQLISQNPLRFDKLYNTQVASDSVNALSLLSGIT